MCPICGKIFKGRGGGVHEMVDRDEIGWEVCKKKECIEKVKARNSGNHKKWFPEEHA